MTRWGRTRRAEDIGYRLDESAPVLSRAVEVASPIDILTPADTIFATITTSSEATCTERLKTGANQSAGQFTSSARRVLRPTGSSAHRIMGPTGSWHHHIRGHFSIAAVPARSRSLTGLLQHA